MNTTTKVSLKSISIALGIVGIVICGILALFAIRGDVTGDVIVKTITTYALVLLMVGVVNVIQHRFTSQSEKTTLGVVSYYLHNISVLLGGCLLIALTWEVTEYDTIRKIIASIGIVNLVIIVIHVIFFKGLHTSRPNHIDQQRPQNTDTRSKSEPFA